MRKSLNRIAAGLTVVATMGSTLLMAGPAFASVPTLMVDTLSRETLSVESTHSLSMTLPTGGITVGNTMTVTWSGFTGIWGTPVPTCGAGTSPTAALSGANVLTLTGITSACTGTLTVTGITMTNPGTIGSKAVTIAGTAGIAEVFAVSIVDSDQVTVTASVDSSITFDIDTITTAWPNTGESAAAYTVALGTLTIGGVNGSNGTVNSIFLDLATNASGGAVVTVSSTNAALKSISVPGDTIPSADGTMAAATANYGICVANVSSTGSNLAKEAGTYDGATCTRTPAGNVVGNVTVAPQNILNTGTDPVAAGRAEILVDAAISVATNAHNDYQDILKFIATGTF